MPQIRRSGPRQEAAPTNHTNAVDSTAPRCQRCRRRLRAPLSQARAHGPTCWHLRYEASLRLVPLDCGCRDPWRCRCTVPALSDNQIDGWADAARYVMDTTGCVPVLPTEVLRRLWQRGGDDRVLAEKLRGVVA